MKWIELYTRYLQLVHSERQRNRPEIFAVLPRYYFASQLEQKFGYSQDYVLRILRCLDRLSSMHNLTQEDFSDTDIKRDRIIDLLQHEQPRDTADIRAKRRA